MSDVERTEDGRYIIVAGRRWRATDPAIPPHFRQELVAELMDARRAVKSAHDDPEAMAAARDRVHHAKVALGERGDPWWEEPTVDGYADRIRSTCLALLTNRGPGSSICPSDIARTVASPDWRPVMDQVRSVADGMAADGDIIITQGESSIPNATGAQGPIRIRLLTEPH